MKTYTRLILLSMLSPLSAFGFVTVGPDSETCDYDSLINAYILSPEYEIRVSNEAPVFNYTASLTGKDRLIKGGYASCEDAANDILEIGENNLVVNSVIDGQNNSTSMRFTNSQGERKSIYLENFKIINGNGTNSIKAGGLDISGDLYINLNNVLIENNQSDFGGGIRVTGDDVVLDIENSTLSENSAIYGGGINCHGNSQINIDNSSVSFNSADYGGGIAANGCVLTHKFYQTGYISHNTARLNGGGVYLENGAELSLTNSESLNTASSLLTNYAGVFGGGAYVHGSDSKLLATNVIIRGNAAELSGGGIYAANDALVRVVKSHQVASSIEQNSADRGGAFTIVDSVLEIDRINIDSNQANEGHGAILFIDNGVADIDNSILTDNSGPDDEFAPSLISVGGLAPSFVSGLYLTVADNLTETFLHVEESDLIHNINFGQSILNDQNVTLDFNVNDSSVNFFCNLMAEMASLDQPNVDADHNIQSLDAGFVGGGDYSLSNDSPAIDMCNGVAGEMDYLGNPRGIDHEGMADGNGLYDSGAFEYQYSNNPDVIFRDGFDD